MLRITPTLLLSMLMVIVFYSFADPPEPPTGKHWEKVEVLSDEFNSWEGSKWQKPLWNNGEPVQMRAENSGVSNGNLWIKATLDNSSVRWFQTSRVMSNTQIKYPMYTECSMKTAHISAYNTFWLNNGNSANRDEIDVCENNSKPSITSQTERPYTMYSQYFIVINNDTERAHGNFDNRNLSASNPLRGIKWNEAYHTLGCWWKDKNHIQFYLDGEPAGSVTSTRDFTRNLNIIWDLWTIDAAWSGGIANKNDLLNNNINTMYVDWVRTWKLEDGTPVVNKIDPPDHLHNLSGKVRIEVCDIKGRVIKTISSDNIAESKKLIQTETSRLATGLYLYRYIIGNKTIIYRQVPLIQ